LLAFRSFKHIFGTIFLAKTSPQPNNNLAFRAESWTGCACPLHAVEANHACWKLRRRI
jgi:hypothetical protein